MTCSFCDKFAYTSMIDKTGIKYFLCENHVKKIKTLDTEEN
jgi:hypothetical protein